MDHTIYTGTIKYNQYDFTYVFDHNLLRLIPTPGKSDEIITNWFMKELAKGTYTFGPLPKMETPFLIGWCNETGAKLIFLPWRGANISRENSVLLVRIAAFIECRSKNQSISKISFTSPELDCIYPVTQGYSCYFDTQGVNSTGVIKV